MSAPDFDWPRLWLEAVGSALSALAQQAQPDENPAARLETPSVEIVGTTPVPGIGTAINEVPANVQVITGSEMRKQESVSVPDYLDRNIGSASAMLGASRGTTVRVRRV